ncbi:MAG: hypothetical protein WC521_09380 [Bdellovibrionales bacterium]|jgi:hypothetical protein
MTDFTNKDDLKLVINDVFDPILSSRNSKVVGVAFGVEMGRVDMNLDPWFLLSSCAVIIPHTDRRKATDEIHALEEYIAVALDLTREEALKTEQGHRYSESIEAQVKFVDENDPYKWGVHNFSIRGKKNTRQVVIKVNEMLALSPIERKDLVSTLVKNNGVILNRLLR